MSDAGAGDSGGGGLAPNLLTGSKMTDFFMKGQPPQEEGKPAAEEQRFTARPKSVSESEADAQAAEPINEQQAGLADAADPAEPAPEEGEAEAGEKGVLDALPADKGTKDRPYKVTDLPADKFIEIKIDGEKETVSLSELATGHIRRKAFNKFANIASAAVNEAKGYAKIATDERESMRTRLSTLFTSAPKLLEFMMEHQPEVAEGFARSYAQIWDAWKKNPEARREYEFARQQKKLKEERDKLQAERTEYERSQQEQAATQAELTRLKPAMQRALKELGFPKVTPKVRATINLLCAAAREANGGRLDPDDLHEAVHQGFKMHPSEKTAVQERRPAPVPPAPAKPKVETRKPTNGKDWRSVPYNKRMNDPEFFLRR